MKSYAIIKMHIEAYKKNLFGVEMTFLMLTALFGYV